MGTIKMNRKLTANQVAELIDVVFRQGAYLKENQRSVKRLAKLGTPALDAMLRAWKDRRKTDLHPIDMYDSMSAFLCAVGRAAPNALIDLIEIEPKWPSIYYALANAKGQRSFEALLTGLKHKNQFVRNAAAVALLERNDKRAVPALINALGDRSHSVKWTIVDAMKKNWSYRRPEAIPLLRRIATSKSVLKRSPFLAETARDLCEQVEKETS